MNKRLLTIIILAASVMAVAAGCVRPFGTRPPTPTPATGSDLPATAVATSVATDGAVTPIAQVTLPPTTEIPTVIADVTTGAPTVAAEASATAVVDNATPAAETPTPVPTVAPTIASPAEPTVTPTPVPTLVPAPEQPGPAITPGTTVTHVVANGEWLLQIARCYGTSYTAIRQANRLPNPDFIQPGQVLTIPATGSDGAIIGPPCVIQHTIQPGETWDSIAQTYATTAAVLQLANPGALVAGRQIWVPAQ